MSERYAITGGCGYVGYRLAMALVRQQPNAHVSLLDIRPPPTNSTKLPTADSPTTPFPSHPAYLTADELGRISFMHCNLCDASSVLACLSPLTGVVYHIASYGMRVIPHRDHTPRTRTAPRYTSGIYVTAPFSSSNVCHRYERR